MMLPQLWVSMEASPRHYPCPKAGRCGQTLEPEEKGLPCKNLPNVSPLYRCLMEGAGDVAFPTSCCVTEGKSLHLSEP